VREIYVDLLAVRQYRAALARHQENWHQACRQTWGGVYDAGGREVLRDWRLDELVAAEVLKVI